jgi:hypothetical protein
VALACSAGLIWSWLAGDSASGWIAVVFLLSFALADWALLTILPRCNLSFGAVKPPLLGLALGRWLITLGVATVGASQPTSSLLVLILIHTLIGALMVYGTILEPFRTQVSRVSLVNEKLTNPGTPLRIVHISDLHVERLTRRERALPDLVAGLRPDVIVLTGDYLSTSYARDPRALDDLKALLGQLHAAGGIYAVWGTPEVDLSSVLRPVLTDLGILLLGDRAVAVTVGDHHLWVMGVNCRRDLDTDGAKLGALLKAAPPGALTLLLHHTPDLMPQAASGNVDLYLAGHTHGGQWRLPGFGAILTSSRYWKRYEAGHYREGNTDLYVSRGLGMEGFGTPRARFFCPPEVVLVMLTGTDNGK